MGKIQCEITTCRPTNRDKFIFFNIIFSFYIIINYCIENNINILYNPAYSPDFNPIECVFSKLKTLYRKLEHNNVIEEIKSVINKITESDLINCYNYSKNFIKNYI